MASRPHHSLHTPSATSPVGDNHTYPTHSHWLGNGPSTLFTVETEQGGEHSVAETEGDGDGTATANTQLASFQSLLQLPEGIHRAILALLPRSGCASFALSCRSARDLTYDLAITHLTFTPDQMARSPQPLLQLIARCSSLTHMLVDIKFPQQRGQTSGRLSLPGQPEDPLERFISALVTDHHQRLQQISEMHLNIGNATDTAASAAKLAPLLTACHSLKQLQLKAEFPDSSDFEDNILELSLHLEPFPPATSLQQLHALLPAGIDLHAMLTSAALRDNAVRLTWSGVSDGGGTPCAHLLVEQVPDLPSLVSLRVDPLQIYLVTGLQALALLTTLTSLHLKLEWGEEEQFVELDVPDIPSLQHLTIYASEADEDTPVVANLPPTLAPTLTSLHLDNVRYIDFAAVCVLTALQHVHFRSFSLAPQQSGSRVYSLLPLANLTCLHLQSDYEYSPLDFGGLHCLRRLSRLELWLKGSPPLPPAAAAGAAAATDNDGRGVGISQYGGGGEHGAGPGGGGGSLAIAPHGKVVTLPALPPSLTHLDIDTNTHNFHTSLPTIWMACTNLTHLRLFAPFLDASSPQNMMVLAQITSLQTLDLTADRPDPSPLDSLTNLTSLVVHVAAMDPPVWPRLRTAGQLAALKMQPLTAWPSVPLPCSLTSLELALPRGDILSSFPPWLSSLRRLQSLHIRPRPALGHGDPDASLAANVHVDLFRNLGGLTRLQLLCVAGLSGGSLGALSSLTQLTELRLEATDGAQLTGYGQLSSLLSLSSLDLRGLASGSLACLDALTRLTGLIVMGASRGAGLVGQWPSLQAAGCLRHAALEGFEHPPMGHLAWNGDRLVLRPRASNGR